MNLTKKAEREFRNTLIESGTIKETVTPAQRALQSKQASQQAAIEARRRELGIKEPVPSEPAISLESLLIGYIGSRLSKLAEAVEEQKLAEARKELVRNNNENNS